ncbi:MAG: GNAT family N-acetyltransferase [Roseovarius sp.]
MVADPARLDALSKAAAEVCDGDGAGRVMAGLMPVDISFRPALCADSRRVWEWRRAMDRAFNQRREETPFDRHDTWFRRAVDDPHRIIRIVVQGQFPCGYLRLDQTDGQRARVSICLSPEVRGQGLGSRLLSEAERLGASLGLEGLEAEIHPGNHVSRRVFASAGYSIDASDTGFLACHRRLEGAT